MSSVKVPNLLKNPNMIQLGDRYVRSYTDSLQGKSGVYLFFRDQVDKCGSCIYFDSRLSQHYYQSKTDKHPMFAYPVADFKWAPIYLTKDYKKDFVDTYGEVSDQMEKILSSFTQQQIRSVEQAVSFHIKPTFFNGAPINNDHGNWQVGDMKGKHELVGTTESGVVLYFDNITHAAKVLGINQSTLRTAYADIKLTLYNTERLV